MAMFAQRFTDKLDRGLVAIAKQSGVFVSWRVQPDEYYDVKYNVYRNGTKLNSTPLSVSNYTDASGSASSSYTVRAVVNGKEQSACAAVKPWNTGRVDKSNKVLFPCPAYYPIKVGNVVNRNNETVWSNNNGTVSFTQDYVINDISLGDLDGDGQIEFIVKRLNQTDVYNNYPTNNSTDFHHIEAYDWDGSLLWWIDCGPNIVSGPDQQWDAVAYDWDEDGKAEVLLRGADDMIVHYKENGVWQSQTVGTKGVNNRGGITHSANQTYMNAGNEYLVYMNGATGKPYWVKNYPLPRGKASDWGDNYGHRSSKYFIGAPFLNGRKASIFLARGIYTKTEMVAYDVDPYSHEITNERRWSSGNSGSWFGQGYHNFGIADVDGDGCDEIVYGSMVIDNNMRGLHTTGLGHGDAQHCGDLDPFRPGLEIFACNEEKPANNYRNATTGEIYFRNTSSGDDGRSMAGNFTDQYPGSIGASTASGVISLTANRVIDGMANNWNGQTSYPMALNFRIYWDGDLLEETLNGPGSAEGEMYVDKLGSRIMQTVGIACINGSKKNPCAQGDIIGDWREELIFRSNNNTEFRIYSTTDATTYRIPSLWYDHQYRQAMVWQSEGYNQPPHTSFFLGKLEGITKAPVPLTNTGRTELSKNSVISSSSNGKALMICDAGNYGIDASGAAPSLLVVNVASTVSGSNNNNGISYSYSQTQLGASINGTDQKGDLTGSMRLAKQGDGLLKLTARSFSYTGDTDIWSGSFYFRGTMENSSVWMNRHTTFYCGADIKKTLTMEYGSALHINHTATDANTFDYTTAKVGTLNLNEGSRVVFQLDPDNAKGDLLEIGTLNIRKQNWEYAPKYQAPVFEFKSSKGIPEGKYKIGTLKTLPTASKLSDIIIESESFDTPAKLVLENGVLYINIEENGVDDSNDIVGHPEKALIVGTEDNKTAFWGAHSPSYQLADGQALHIEFRNYNGNGNAYNNYVLACSNNRERNDDASGYKEFFVARADNHGWGNDWSSINRNYSCNWGNNFVSMMNGAWVTMDIQHFNNAVKVETTVTALNGQTFTDSFTDNSVLDDVVRVFLTVDNSHLAIDRNATEIINLYEKEIAYVIDFEETSTDYYGFTGNCAVSQADRGDGTHLFHIDQAGGSGDRNSNISFASVPMFSQVTNYKFEFDWGHAVSNQNNSRTTVLADKGSTLFYIDTPKYGASTVYDANGKKICDVVNDGYSKACPTKLSHIEITSNEEQGTYLTITYNGGIVVSNVQLSPTLQHITGINNVLGRAVSHTALDNIMLTNVVNAPLDGDVDGNGTVNIVDAVEVVVNIVAGKTEKLDKGIYDIDGNGVIDFNDAKAIIQLFLTGKAK